MANQNRNDLSRLPQSDDELMQALYESFLMARRDKLKTADEYKFEVRWQENLEQLAEDIMRRKYKPGRSKAFITHTPVNREIFAAPFRDRIVHHLLYAIVAPWWDRRFIDASTSCRVGRGTDYGIRKMQTSMRKASKNGQEKAYVMKGDISGYFMSLRRELLYEKVMKGLKKQFPQGGWLYRLCAYLWKVIIFDDPTTGVRIAGRKSDWKCLPANKSLFCQPAGQGIVIGNLTSQLLSNIMLNEFDWFMKRTLGFKYYGRYVDDFYVVVPENDYGYALAVFKEILPVRLQAEGLTLHPKKIYVQEVHKGCPFLGKVVHLDALLPGKRFRKNSKRVFRGFCSGRCGDIESVISYIGMAKNMSAKKYMAKVFSENGLEYRF